MYTDYSNQLVGQLAADRQKEQRFLVQAFSVNGRERCYQVNITPSKQVSVRRASIGSYCASFLTGMFNERGIGFTSATIKADIRLAITVREHHRFDRHTLECETQPKYEHYPQTSAQWFACAAQVVSDANPKLTLLLDLDNTIFTSWIIERMHKPKTLTRCKKRVFVDPDAMQQIKAFIGYGHQLIIITSANYCYSDIHELFLEYRINVPACNYYNCEDYIHEDNGKAGAIKRIGFSNAAMLIDDLKSNKPDCVWFTQAKYYEPFPNISGRELDVSTQSESFVTVPEFEEAA
ncbi:MAG: hypothetical protein ACPGUD_12445 [Parashewanella sp.]